MKQLLDRLQQTRSLPPHELHTLLSSFNEEHLSYAQELARNIASERFGNRVYIRGLIEIGNCCGNDCLYCGIRKSNKTLQRYRLSQEQVLQCAEEGYALGFRTFVLQGGEDPWLTDDKVVSMVQAIRQRYPDAAITLSLGERPGKAYQRFKQAGANRYLLRHETVTPEHYATLHPKSMDLKNRLRCLQDLKQLGFQTGSGIMVGSPGQTTEHLVADILFLQSLQPQMIGIGPFLPHHATPFAQEKAGALDLTLMLLCILRMMHPEALIPSTTALASLHPQGREMGILSGCNVVMPNLSPSDTRKNYALYDNKASMGAEAAEGLHLLGERLAKIGYEIDFSRGDYKPQSTINIRHSHV